MVSTVNFWSTDLNKFILFISTTWDKKWVLACPNFGERTARVKLEWTDFRKNSKNTECRAYIFSRV